MKSLYLFLLFTSIICYGVGIFIVYIPEKTMKPFETQNTYFLVSLGRFSGISFLLIFTTKFSDLKLIKEWKKEKKYIKPFVYTVISSFLNILGYLPYEKLIVNGQSLSLTSVLIETFVFIPILYGIFVFKDKLNIYKYFGFFFFIISFVFIGIGKVQQSKECVNEYECLINNNNTITNVSDFDLITEDSSNNLINIFWVVLSVFCWGVGGVLQIISMKICPYTLFLYFLYVGQLLNLITSTIIFFIGNFSLSLESFIIFIGYFITDIGSVSSIYLSAQGDTSKWNALIHLNIVITVLLSVIFFDEILNAWLYVGMGFLFLCSVLVSI